VIFVDNPKRKLGRMKMCHMVSDTSLAELHAFAASIGCKREWFQRSAKSPHYDLPMFRREIALLNGAQSLGSKGIIYALKRWRIDGSP
jgi:hypothetical protein